MKTIWESHPASSFIILPRHRLFVFPNFTHPVPCSCLLFLLEAFDSSLFDNWKRPKATNHPTPPQTIPTRLVLSVPLAFPEMTRAFQEPSRPRRLHEIDQPDCSRLGRTPGRASSPFRPHLRQYMPPLSSTSHPLGPCCMRCHRPARRHPTCPPNIASTEHAVPPGKA